MWIGLYDRDHFTDTDESSNCRCGFGVDPSDCQDCRDRFVWIDGTPVSDHFAPWNDNEPQSGERCVRMTDDTVEQWRGYSCSSAIDFVCSRGNKLNRMYTSICISLDYVNGSLFFQISMNA